jgi:uncharacterized protein (TIGR02246 family)
MIRLLAVAAVAITGLGITEPLRGQRSRADEDAIRQIIASTTEAMNKHNAKALARLYTPDGELDNVFGERWRSPAEIEKLLQVHFDAELREAKFSTSNVDVKFIRPDVAIAHVTNQVSGIVGPNGQHVPTHDERSMRVFVKTNGQWLVTGFHNTQVSPPGASGR